MPLTWSDLYLGMVLDVHDTASDWMLATVEGMDCDEDGQEQVYVQYVGWEQAWNEVRRHGGAGKVRQ